MPNQQINNKIKYLLKRYARRFSVCVCPRITPRCRCHCYVCLPGMLSDHSDAMVYFSFSQSAPEPVFPNRTWKIKTQREPKDWESIGLNCGRRPMWRNRRKEQKRERKKKSAPNANVYRYIVFIIHVLLRINIENWRHTILCVWYSLFHHRWLYWTIFGRCFMGSKIKNAPLRISVQCSAGCRACVMARTTYEKEAFVRYTCKTFAFLVSKLYLFQTRKR